MRKFFAVTLFAALAAAGVHASSSVPLSYPAARLGEQAAMPASGASGVAVRPSKPTAPELSKADADIWLDGFMPYALESGDVAGAVVVIVKDGKILTQRGYGYANIAARKKVDPENTMFRVGSTSKLFTWTAVMQLVEQGKIDLDVDINRYLDFKIPPFQGKPVTMRHILTHTAGFEDAAKGGITYHGRVDPLGDVVKKLLPKRVFAPGTTPAYSNFATALAGYIVERVSGIPFNTYIERKIFQPLDMDHSSFRQPLPASLAPYMATGYPRASADPKPFELISVPPAGSLSMSGTDGAKFMIAQLNDGAGLMKPETAKMMHNAAYNEIPGLDRMALGFYEQRINDVQAIAHGGDLMNFHGYMWMFPATNVGLMVEMNSTGRDHATDQIRQKLFEQFADRYFPAADQKAPTELPSAKKHAKMLAGNYFSSRGQFTTFLDIVNLIDQQSITLDADGRPLVPDLFGGSPDKWIEVSPFVWHEANGHGRLAATVENGHVVRWSVNEVSPFMVFLRVPWYRNAAWLLPLLLVSLTIVAVAGLYWPASAIMRRQFGTKLALTGRHLVAYRLAFGLSCFTIIAVLFWIYLLTVFLGSLSGADWPILLCRIIGTVAFIALPVAAIWNMVLTWKRGASWAVKLSSGLLSFAALVIFWVAFDFHLIGLSVRF